MRSICACNSQAVGDTKSRPKGGTVEYRNGPQFKTSLWGKRQGDLLASTAGEHGIGAYCGHEMLFVSIEREVCVHVSCKRDVILLRRYMGDG